MSVKRSLKMCNISWDMPIKENPVKAIYKRTISVYIYIDWNKLKCKTQREEKFKAIYSRFGRI